ncbi:radical SAM protein [Mycoplasmatota bacterium WC44]
MKYIPAKKILSTSKNPSGWFGGKYGLNIYRGCNHGCIYCDSRSNVYQVENFSEVKVKEDAISKLETELQSKRVKGIISMGSMSDPYNKYEENLELTRKSLELINKYKFGVNITTKSALVVRDIDLLKKIQRHSNVLVSITITTYDDSLSKIIEPGCSNTKERFEALSILKENGIYAGITLQPLLPKINDSYENVTSIIKKASEAGVDYIYSFFGVTIRDGQREYLYKNFAKNFPFLIEFYNNTFKNNYVCHSLISRKLYSLSEKLCDEHGILYKMKDIIEESGKFVVENQMTLF